MADVRVQFTERGPSFRQDQPRTGSIEDYVADRLMNPSGDPHDHRGRDAAIAQAIGRLLVRLIDDREPLTPREIVEIVEPKDRLGTDVTFV